MSSKLFEIDARMDLLRGLPAHLPEPQSRDFDRKFEISWIYHDHALEGIVMTHQELTAALDNRNAVDSGIAGVFREIKKFKSAIDFIKLAALRKRFQWSVTLLKEICAELDEGESPANVKYRKDTPLHRLYFHDISPPEKIPYRMRKLQEWMHDSQNVHPIRKAVEIQQRIMSIFPFQRNSGKVARLAMNLHLLRSGYLPAIIHAVERQRYYECLRANGSGLTDLVVESIDNAIDTKLKFFSNGSEYQRLAI
jgi:Fic family protein